MHRRSPQRETSPGQAGSRLHPGSPVFSEANDRCSDSQLSSQCSVLLGTPRLAFFPLSLLRQSLTFSVRTSFCSLKARETVTVRKQMIKTIPFFGRGEVSGLPSPLRNLLTPLGSGSGQEARYSAARTSNRPVKRDELDQCTHTQSFPFVACLLFANDLQISSR